ncbi:RraA family protein [Oceanobacillus neutriphilus]|uniref:Putative 4-hydroxy-4-methyl-2-oxoglutarate aldolase n=1 Tax=Oceanobacillus neutriphilus TaxID=531815 RepID=A0ABQ2P1H6_9BACI|nr:RraA family protein [Oceanobacillus neutriphilus]GGP15820.1 methyltransferase [Oceanobacillus neutriphilus]
MSNFGNRVYSKVNRPEKELVEQFSNLEVADISDCMNKMGCIDSSIRPFNDVNLLGTAVTVKVPGGNNLMFHAALSLAKEGDVIVVDGEGYTGRGICGENMIEIARQKGIRGFVVDGAIRDSKAAVNSKDFPVFAKMIQPNGAAKGNGPGEVNVPVSVGGTVIYPGDIIVGDEDGVVAVRPQYAETIAAETKELAEKQAKNLELIKAGKSDRSWVTKALENAGYKILDQTWDEN